MIEARDVIRLCFNFAQSMQPIGNERSGTFYLSPNVVLTTRLRQTTLRRHLCEHQSYLEDGKGRP
jgi:hypothetical protein